MDYHVNGELVARENATVSVEDRGFAYGDAVFETLRAYGGSIFEWNAHLERLESSCAALDLEHGLSGATLRERVQETLGANDLEDAYVRLSITRGVQPGTLAPRDSIDPTVVITVKPLPRGGVSGERVWDEPASLAVADIEAVPDAALPAHAKTHNYLSGVLARLETDADEALLCEPTGAITEGTVSNLWFVAEETLKTPALDGPVLPGITRAVILDLAADLDIPVETGTYTVDELEAASAIMLSNTTWELRPVSQFETGSLEGRPPQRSIPERLLSAFDERVEARHY